MITILKGHTSPDTAYVVDDYPYGFCLRCKIRYWLAVHPKLGVRLMSQTSNPKKPGLVWNKPKASTYCRFGGCLILDDINRVHWLALQSIPTRPKPRNGLPSMVRATRSRQCPSFGLTPRLPMRRSATRPKRSALTRNKIHPMPLREPHNIVEIVVGLADAERTVRTMLNALGLDPNVEVGRSDIPYRAL
jgi:hypothetical protein